MQSAQKIGQEGPTADRSSGAQNESPQEALQMTELQEALRAVEAERGHTQASTSAAEAVEAQDPALPDLKGSAAGSSQAGGSKDERGPPAGEGIDRDEDVQDDSDDELETMLVERHKRRTEAASAKKTDPGTRSGGSLPSAASSASSISDEDAARSSFAKIKWRNMPPLPPARDKSTSSAKSSPAVKPGRAPSSSESSMQALTSTEPAAATSPKRHQSRD